ncbi:MAG: DUF3891 family protein [Thermoleophilia bacterium]|nr:DUF3891 family protein [Thermoleophilia bacterium]
MIIARLPEGLRVVMQVDHQLQCVRMADAWGGEGFARPEPYGPLAAAARWHDEGWRAWEARPQVDAEGRPVDFTEIDPEPHTALYRRGIARSAAEGRLAGLLVSRHGQGLYEKRLGLDGDPRPRGERPPVVRAFLADQDALQRGLAPAAPAGGWVWAAYRLLQTWDVLSLYLTWRGLAGGGEWRLPRVPRAPDDEAGVTLTVRPLGPDTAAVEPWPFAADRVALPVPARVIPDRRYAGPAGLAAALARAPARVVPFAVARG